MSAMNGSGVSFRSRGRVIGCCLALALAVSALVFAPAAANAAGPAAGGPIYLALGDSISFGYSHQKFNENYPTESPSRFEEGFDNFFNKDLTKTNKGSTIENLSCPGETSNGLIGENAELGGETSTEETDPPALYQGIGDWHPCAYHNVDGFPLHAGYGKLSQLEDAVSILTSENKITGKPNTVDAITLNIGSNDELAAIAQCKIEVQKEYESSGKSVYGSSPEAAVIGCIEYTAQHVTFPHILKNIGDILGVLDHYYSGPIVLLGFYNPDTNVLPGSDTLQEDMNAAVEKEILPHFPNVAYANPFPVFNKGAGKSATQEQASLCKYTEMCNTNPGIQEVPEGNAAYGIDGDIHPTVLGYKTLASLINKAYKGLVEKGV
jgi:lysophospholipase L1-like esterase